MLVYLGGFALSTGLLALSAQKDNRMRYLLIAVALMIPCLIAGFRGPEVGTDTQVYLMPMYKAAVKAESFQEYLSSSWYHIWQDLYVRNYEIGFTGLVFLVSKVTKSLVAVQLFIQAFTVVPVYLAVSRNQEHPVWFSMLVYYLMFFNSSLNLMRQFIAMAFVLLAVQYLIEKQYIKYCIGLLLGFLFHTSAVIGIAIGIVYLLVTRKKELTNLKIDSRNLAMAVILCIGILLVIRTDFFVNMLHILGLGKYELYIAGMTVIMPKQIIIRLPLLILCIIHWKSDIDQGDNYRFYFMMICLDIIFSQFTSVNVYGGRIARYFAMFQILYFSAFYKKENYQNMTRLIMILYMICYWTIFFAIRGQDSTVPYLPFWS